MKIIRDYLQELFSNGIPITKAIVFGSIARGTAGEDSDIDLMLISPLFDTNDDRYYGKLWRLTKVSNYRIEPIAVGERRFLEDDSSPIIEIARREGIEVQPMPCQ